MQIRAPVALRLMVTLWLMNDTAPDILGFPCIRGCAALCSMSVFTASVECLVIERARLIRSLTGLYCDSD